MALLLGSLRKAKKRGERAEDDVLAQLDRELPNHWVIVGLIPPKRAKDGEKRYSCKEIDAVIIADRLIYVVEIKSHEGKVRVRSGHPFQLNGVDIKDAGNQGAGFWDNHDKQCNHLKDILRIKLCAACNCIVPRFIWAGSPQFEYGSSGLDEHVTNCSTFIKLAVTEDARSSCAPLSQSQVTALARYLADDEDFTAPARVAPKRPASLSPAGKSPRTGARPTGHAPAPPRPTQPASGNYRPPWQPGPGVITVSPAGSATLANSSPRTPRPDPVPSEAITQRLSARQRSPSLLSTVRLVQKIPWLAAIGSLIALWILSSVASYIFNVVKDSEFIEIATSRPGKRSSVMSSPHTRVFTSDVSYEIAPSLDGQAINMRTGPSSAYPVLVPISLGYEYEIVGHSTTTASDGSRWIFAWLPQDGWSGFVAEHLLRARPEAPKSPILPNFMCGRDLDRLQRTICDDANLAAKDRELGSLYAYMLVSAPGSYVEATQRSWTEERDRCGRTGDIAGCLHMTYERRIAELRSWSVSQR